ncbi:lipocalin-like domain-containing protein [Nitrospira japonica]|nr:lipocalin-like domain-containing protein [Nitrospira japonica]
METSNRRCWWWALPALPLLATLTFAAKVTDEFRPATKGYVYQFPRDHGSHDEFRTEWWYYTGHLATATGRRFGYQLTFFRRGVPKEQITTFPSQWSISHLYLAHFAVTDLDGRQFRYAEKLSRAGLGKAGADSDRLHVWIDRWSAEAHPDPVRHRLQAADQDLALALDLTPDKPPVVHGTGGISRKGAAQAQASHYYSFTSMAAAGQLRIGHESFDVTGTGWMDHEFGSADLGEDVVGWDWFSLQLSDRTELMLYRLRRADGSADPVSSGTFIDKDGTPQHLAFKDLKLEPLSRWTSPASKAVYPQRWRLTVASKQLSLELAPLMAEQELTTTRSTQVTYWEGAIDVTGTVQEKPITGKGYMELTGYAERFTKKL